MEMGRLKFVEMNQEEYTWQVDVLDPEKMIYRPADPEDETDKQMLLCMRTSFPCSKDVSLETDIWHGVGQSRDGVVLRMFFLMVMMVMKRHEHEMVS